MLLKICVASGRRSSMNAGMLQRARRSANKFDVRASIGPQSGDDRAQPRFNAAPVSSGADLGQNLGQSRSGLAGLR
jgi:hypothetical protein